MDVLDCNTVITNAAHQQRQQWCATNHKQIESNESITVPITDDGALRRHHHHHHRMSLPVPNDDHNHYLQMATTHSSRSNHSSRHVNHEMIVPRVLTLALLVLLCPTTLADVLCPHVNLIHRLTAPNGAPVNRYSQMLNHTPECECTTIEEGGWEITCYASDEESKSKEPKMDFDSPDYSIDYNVLHTSFTVRYEIGRQLKLACDKGAPAFKPALFQGLWQSGRELKDVCL